MPSPPEWFERGLQAIRAGRPAEALALGEEALREAPESVAAWHLRGLALLALERLDLAEESFSRLAALRADLPEAHFLLAIARQRVGRAVEAIAALREAVRLRPGFVEALRMLGDLLVSARRPAEGIAAYRSAVAAGGGGASLLSNLGYALLSLEKNDEAAQVLERAVAADPSLAAARNNLGMARHASGNVVEALAAYEHALALAPADADAQVNRALALWHLRRVPEAQLCARHCAAMPGITAEALQNLGQIWREMREPEAALTSFRAAVAADPSHRMARYALGAELLAQGRWEEGWRAYSWRASRLDRNYPVDAQGVPLELPADLSGLRVLVHGEQGPGDDLFYLRFVPELRRRGARVELAGKPAIEALVADTGLFDTSGGSESPALRVHSADLPYLLGAHRDPIPPPLVLAAEPARIEVERAHLERAGPGPYLGITWRAGKRPEGGWRNRYFKLIDPARLGAALADVAATFVIVQRLPQPGESAAFGQGLGGRVVDRSACNADLREALALLACLDGYVGVSNTNMHLAAGLGRPAHVLVQNPPEWRWMNAGESSPWFPGFRLYREEPVAGWDPALAALRAALRT